MFICHIILHKWCSVFFCWSFLLSLSHTRHQRVWILNSYYPEVYDTCTEELLDCVILLFYRESHIKTSINTSFIFPNKTPSVHKLHVHTWCSSYTSSCYICSLLEAQAGKHQRAHTHAGGYSLQLCWANLLLSHTKKKTRSREKGEGERKQVQWMPILRRPFLSNTWHLLGYQRCQNKCILHSAKEL